MMLKEKFEVTKCNLEWFISVEEVLSSEENSKKWKDLLVERSNKKNKPPINFEEYKWPEATEFTRYELKSKFIEELKQCVRKIKRFKHNSKSLYIEKFELRIDFTVELLIFKSGQIIILLKSNIDNTLTAKQLIALQSLPAEKYSELSIVTHKIVAVLKSGELSTPCVLINKKLYYYPYIHISSYEPDCNDTNIIKGVPLNEIASIGTRHKDLDSIVTKKYLEKNHSFRTALFLVVDKQSTLVISRDTPLEITGVRYCIAIARSIKFHLERWINDDGILKLPNQDLINFMIDTSGKRVDMVTDSYNYRILWPQILKELGVVEAIHKYLYKKDKIKESLTRLETDLQIINKEEVSDCDMQSDCRIAEIVEHIISPHHKEKNIITSVNQEEYQSSFSEEAKRKAEKILEFIEKTPLHQNAENSVYVSIGGGEGAEIIHILDNSNIKYGIFCEFMDEARTKAEKIFALKYNNPSIRVKSFSGDVAQRTREIIDHLGELKKNGVNTLILSFQAILHELPNRTDPSKYSNDIIWQILQQFEKCVLLIREPMVPIGVWTKKVQLTVPGVQNDRLILAAQEVAMRIQNLSKNNNNIKKLHPDYTHTVEIGRDTNQIILPVGLAVELLHKILRFNDRERLIHELEECLTSINPYEFYKTTVKYFPAHNVYLTTFTSQGFDSVYREARIIAENENSEQLPPPETHFSLYAWREKKLVIAS